MCPSAALSDWLHEKHTIQSLIHQQLLHAQRLMKFQADKHRSKHTFAVGSWIYLKLQPHVLSSVAPCANQKLAYKFFGPFLIAYLIILRYIQSFMCHSWSKPFQWMSRWPCCLGHWMNIRYLNVSSNVELLRYQRYCFLAGSCSVVRLAWVAGHMGRLWFSSSTIPTCACLGARRP